MSNYFAIMSVEKSWKSYDDDDVMSREFWTKCESYIQHLLYILLDSLWLSILVSSCSSIYCYLALSSFLIAPFVWVKEIQSKNKKKIQNSKLCLRIWDSYFLFESSFVQWKLILSKYLFFSNMWAYFQPFQTKTMNKKLSKLNWQLL